MATYPSELDRHFTLPEVVHVETARPLHWLALGWADMWRHPGPSLAYGLFAAGLGWLIMLYAVPHYYLATTAVSGFLLVSPLLGAGLYELSRDRDAGRQVDLFSSFGWMRRNASSTGYYAVMLAVAAIAWERLSAILFALLYGGSPATLSEFLESVFLSGEYWQLAVGWAVCGAILATVVFSLSAVAIPMLVDRPIDPVTAAMTSVRAVNRSRGAMALWAAIIVGLTVVGFATLLFGMIIVMPWLAHATWYAYKDTVH